MDFVPLLAMAALVVTVINFLKYARTRDWNAAATQVSVWVGGVVVVWLVANTDWADTLVFGDIALSDMNAASLVFFGVSVGAIGSVGHEVVKAVDNSDSAHKPPLFSRDD
jgi:hypothetical protein